MKGRMQVRSLDPETWVMCCMLLGAAPHGSALSLKLRAPHLRDSLAAGQSAAHSVAVLLKHWPEAVTWLELVSAGSLSQELGIGIQSLPVCVSGGLETWCLVQGEEERSREHLLCTGRLQPRAHLFTLPVTDRP